MSQGTSQRQQESRAQELEYPVGPELIQALERDGKVFERLSRKEARLIRNRRARWSRMLSRLGV